MRSQMSSEVKWKNHEENINIIKEQYKQVQKVYTTRMEDYEQKLKNLEAKYKQLDFKRNSEIEGFINENNLIRKRMKSYEEYVHKLKQMTIGGLDQKRMTEIQQEIGNTEGKFGNGSRHFKKSLDDFKNKLVSTYKNRDIPEHDEGFNDGRSINEEINEHSYNDGPEMEMI